MQISMQIICIKLKEIIYANYVIINLWSFFFKYFWRPNNHAAKRSRPLIPQNLANHILPKITWHKRERGGEMREKGGHPTRRG
jgi:hypothetical protein